MARARTRIALVENGNGKLRRVTLIVGLVVTLFGVLGTGSCGVYRAVNWYDWVNMHVRRGDALIRPVEAHIETLNPKHWSVDDRREQAATIRRIEDLELMFRFQLRRAGVDPDDAIAVERLRDARGSTRKD